jgi:hypothetical protein
VVTVLGIYLFSEGLGEALARRRGRA